MSGPSPNEAWYTRILGIEPALGEATGPLRQIVYAGRSGNDAGRTTKFVTKATMTFLFTDIEGSTRQWEESPAMHALVDQHFAALHAAVDMARGEVFATMGDGIAAAFTSAEAAVRAAISGQLKMSSIGLAVRMGIHTGEVQRVGRDYRGRPVNRAARIMAVSNGGQILLSDVSAALLRSGPGPVELTDLGVHRLRDLTDPERLWQVVHSDLDHRFPAVRSVDANSDILPADVRRWTAATTTWRACRRWWVSISSSR